jgi:hypothetical protein
MEDINQRQKICLTPVDEHINLLRSKPKDWNKIKNNKFLIINGQHKIAASKELQLEGCGKQRRLTWRSGQQSLCGTWTRFD